MDEKQDVKMPQMRALSAIVKDYPHLSDGKKQCLGAEPHITQPDEYKEDPAADIKTVMNQLMLRPLQKPLLSMMMQGHRYTQQELQELLQKQTAALPTFGAKFEDELLVEAGKFSVKLQGPVVANEMMFPDGCEVMRDFQPCLNEEKDGCFNRTRFGRWVMTGLQMPQEWDNFIKKNIQPPRRICLLCHRIAAPDIAYATSTNSSKSSTLWYSS
jgi:hypothetical protein